MVIVSEKTDLHGGGEQLGRKMTIGKDRLARAVEEGEVRRCGWGRLPLIADIRSQRQ